MRPLSRLKPGPWLSVALLLVGACADEPEPTSPRAPTVQPGVDGALFRLTIDAASGAIQVEPPRRPAGAAAGLSFSLLGSDAIALHAGSCTWSTIPRDNRHRRCTFELAIENRLRDTDLVTSTDLALPPQGTSGIVVFPFTAAAEGVPGGGATASPDWDNAPYNFFNDFGGCSSSSSSDCYRWELFAGPLAARTTSAARQVGFDVDKAAHSVSVNVAVAADLRDRPPTELRIASGGERCGTIVTEAGVPVGVTTDVLNLFVGARPVGVGTRISRSFCSFPLPAGLDQRLLVGATLEMFQRGDDIGVPFTELGSVLAEHVNYGGSLDAGDYNLPPLQPALAVLSSAPGFGDRSVDVTRAVMDDIANGRTETHFRLRFATEVPTDLGGETAYIGAAGGTAAPVLVVQYRER